MISAEKVREVAARMREIMRHDPHGWLDAMVEKAVVDVMGEGVTIGETLADLIDRPTCRDVGDSYHVLDFVCSECGCELDVNDREGEPTMWNGGTAMVPKYCPNCGAEVVRDVD